MKWVHLDGTECVAGWDVDSGECAEGGGPVISEPALALTDEWREVADDLAEALVQVSAYLPLFDERTSLDGKRKGERVDAVYDRYRAALDAHAALKVKEAAAGPGHVVDVPVSASEPNPPKAGR